MPTTETSFSSLDTERAEVITFWTAVLDAARRHVEGPAAPLAQRHLKYLAKRACWAVTEIHPSVGTKLLRQRYWSEAALALLNRPATQRKGSPSLASMLRHEHVVPLKELTAKLQTAHSKEEIRAVLESAVACVVTKAEARRLDAVKGLSGWARYEHLGIVPQDRSESGSAMGAVQRPAATAGSSQGQHAADPPAARSEVVAALLEIRERGGERHFRRIHHFDSPLFSGTGSSLNVHLEFCRRARKGLKGENLRTHQRTLEVLVLVKSGTPWEEAIVTAWERWPVVTR